MSPLFFRVLLLGFASWVLAGCCANSACNCNDAHADAIYLQFHLATNASDTTGFLADDVDTVYVRRFAASTLKITPLHNTPYDSEAHDSVAIVRLKAQASNSVVINNNSPFAAVSGHKLNNFSYDVFVEPNKKSKYRRDFLLSDITLRGSFEGTGCCTCYRNTYKVVNVNYISHNVTETGQQPRPILLSKK